MRRRKFRSFRQPLRERVVDQHVVAHGNDKIVHVRHRRRGAKRRRRARAVIEHVRFFYDQPIEIAHERRRFIGPAVLVFALRVHGNVVMVHVESVRNLDLAGQSLADVQINVLAIEHRRDVRPLARWHDIFARARLHRRV